MDISRILLDILIVLVVAKLAAEGSERIGVPAVVGEILAGIVVGPSLLGWVGRGDEVLRSLGEIGVILLLLDVGLEMDLVELRKVGRSAFTVATIGVIVPMVGGIVAMEAIGAEFNTALFVGAALTATSVGITARVFGDLRALATTEARIVLGAAVADDVMGLVVLTVVVRLVTEGSVSVVSVLGIVGLAVAFLVVSGGAGLRLAPPLFRAVSRFSRGGGTLVALAFAFTLGFAELAHAAKLAPIVGAFVAGLALTRSDQAERIRGELAPVGHLFIPIFFLQIGIDAEVGAFGRVAVLRDAAILLLVAVVGKLVASAGARGRPGDKLLIGLGMLPRGEVGLIFATIGLANGVLDDDLYASLLLVVLATTLVTPPLLKQRYRAIAGRTRGPSVGGDGEGVDLPMPELIDVNGEVRLSGPAPVHAALEIALRAALLAGRASPSGDLMTWLSALPDDAAQGWSVEERELLIDVVERGNARSWRFLENVGILDRALPELAKAIRGRRSDPFELDPDAAYRWRALERLRVLDQDDSAVQEARRLDDPTRLLLAALLIEALDAEIDPEGTARRLVARIGLEPDDRDEVLRLVADRDLLWAAARRAGAFSEDTVIQLAGHLGPADHARATYVLAALRDAGHEAWERARLAQLHDLVQDVLTRDTESAGPTRDLLDQRRSEVVSLVGDDPVAVARATGAPSAFLLGIDPAIAAPLLRRIDPLPSRRHVRVDRSAGRVSSVFAIGAVSRDQPGLLAAMASSLAAVGLDVQHAKLATWPDGAALEWFEAVGEVAPDPADLAARTEAALASPPSAGPLPGVTFEFDDRASPWHTVCEVTGPSEPGLLADLATVFRAAGAAVRSATIDSHEGVAYDVFELTDRNGRKLEPATEETIRRLAAEGVVLRRGLFRKVVIERPEITEPAAP